MPGSCPLIRRLRDPDILTQPPVEQAVAPKKRPPEAYFPRRLSIIGPDLTSEYLFTTMHTRAARRLPRLGAGGQNWLRNPVSPQKPGFWGVLSGNPTAS